MWIVWNCIRCWGLILPRRRAYRSIETVIDWISNEVNMSKTCPFSNTAFDCHLETLPDLASLPVFRRKPLYGHFGAAEWVTCMLRNMRLCSIQGLRTDQPLSDFKTARTGAYWVSPNELLCALFLEHEPIRAASQVCQHDNHQKAYRGKINRTSCSTMFCSRRLKWYEILDLSSRDDRFARLIQARGILCIKFIIARHWS